MSLIFLLLYFAYFKKVYIECIYDCVLLIGFVLGVLCEKCKLLVII